MLNEKCMATVVEILLLLIPVLIVVEYIGDFLVLFKFGPDIRAPNIDISDLTSLVVALLFFFAFGNFSKRLRTVEFKED